MAAAYLLVLLIFLLGIIPLFTSGSQPGGTAPEVQPAAGENGGGTEAAAPASTTAAPGPPLHFVSSAPAAGSTVVSRPADVSVTFDAELMAPVSITIDSDGRDYGSGDTSVDENGMTLRRLLDPIAPDGLYNLSYHACWTDGNCGDGSFQFIIDRTGGGG